MFEAAFTEPVKDSIAKVNGEVAVGEDLEFQHKWWRFERFVWVLFAIIVMLDLAGAFGRGPLAHAEVHASDNSIDLKYDRVQRTGTPSMVRLQFGPGAIKDRTIVLFASESVVKELGAERVIPAPQSTVIGHGGLTYSFPASSLPASVAFSLRPDGPGIRRLTLQVAGAAPVRVTILVVP